MHRIFCYSSEVPQNLINILFYIIENILIFKITFFEKTRIYTISRLNSMTYQSKYAELHYAFQSII